MNLPLLHRSRLSQWPLVTLSFISCLFIFISISITTVQSASSCKDDKLIVYRVVLNTFWSPKRFPKHYPQWRPPASFSRLIGRSHESESQTFYDVGKTASEGMRLFAESGTSEVLDELSQGEGGIFDEFNAPPIAQGLGRSEAEFFVDGNHSRVSLIVRIVPSPDWFIGLSAFNLCSNGRWLDSVTLEQFPLDAGTDNGFTFTSPNWPTEPRAKVSRITTTQPNHPASSFFYPDWETLPPIASFQFIKVKEYELSQVFHHDQHQQQHQHQQQQQEDRIREREKHRYHLDGVEEVADTEISSNDVTDGIGIGRIGIGIGSGRPAESNLKSATAASSVSSSSTYSMANGPLINSFNTFNRNSNSIAGIEYLPSVYEKPNKKKKYKEHKHQLKKFRPPRDCQTSEWGPWSPCSKTCGIGEKVRTRVISIHPRRGGRPCPALKEATFCGSARNCGRSYFNW